MLGTVDADTSGATVAMGTPDASTLSGQAITVVYTDGACSRNPGPGGWAWAVPGGYFTSGAAERSTNQRMEITAVLEALKKLEGPTGGRERLDVRYQLLPGPMVGGLASQGLDHQSQAAGCQSRPVGAIDRDRAAP
jgi:hypothetical protein